VGRLPLYYGWVVLASLCCVGFSRQGLGIATLSIFVNPLAQEFGWSRTAISGAASLAGLLAAFVSPLIGPILDRQGSRFILCAAVLVNGVLLILLSLTPSLLIFYLLYCVARLNWASPFDLGIYSAVNNWFVDRRAAASSIATLAQSAGLVAMPLIAQFAIVHDGWRAGWFVLGIVTLVVGFLPTWLFLVGRPEDLGLLPDRAVPPLSGPAAVLRSAEPRFSRAQALRTPAFWLLLSYSVLVYPVQAGISLHQAPLMIERGLGSTLAATIVSFFSLMSAVATIVCGIVPRRVPIRYSMAVAGFSLMAGAIVMPGIASASEGFIAAGLFGFGVGGILTLLPVAWADYFGRANFGAIRSLALSAQVLAQACGPLLSGALRDWTGNYQASLHCFAVLAALSIVAALFARRPAPTP
jgi:MFS family permease